VGLGIRRRDKGEGETHTGGYFCLEGAVGLGIRRIDKGDEGETEGIKRGGEEGRREREEVNDGSTDQRHGNQAKTFVVDKSHHRKMNSRYSAIKITHQSL
jgi:hypothetical protein